MNKLKRLPEQIFYSEESNCISNEYCNLIEKMEFFQGTVKSNSGRIYVEIYGFKERGYEPKLSLENFYKGKIYAIIRGKRTALSVGFVLKQLIKDEEQKFLRKNIQDTCYFSRIIT